MLWLIMCCCALALLSVGLLIKIFLMRKAAGEIEKEFIDKLKEDTNTLISISSRDKAMMSLADNINAQLRELRAARHRFMLGDLELKNAITNISHDIRTPLAAICAYLDLLDTCEKNDVAAEYINIIRNRAEMLRQLTEELFRYSMVITPVCETVVGVVEDVVVNTLLEESIAGFYAVLREKKITPNVRMTEKKIVRKLNRESLSRIFSNLISNAVKYSDGDLDIELTDEGEMIFANAASKLNEVQVGRLFDRFYTVETYGKSTGLGLAIARTLVEQMNGSITAEYEKGRLLIRMILN